MGTRALTVATVCALATAASGCGSGDTKPTAAGPPVDQNDKRAVALECLRDKEGLNARAVDEKSIEIDGLGGPRITFFQSSLEAEARQFEGKAEGAQQIGAALLFVREMSEPQLDKIEACLSEQ
ncbi:MAG: hypothetical protein ACR2FZ_05595 [Thermoleophilaceae bacterium]